MYYVFEVLFVFVEVVLFGLFMVVVCKFGKCQLIVLEVIVNFEIDLGVQLFDCLMCMLMFIDVGCVLLLQVQCVFEVSVVIDCMVVWFVYGEEVWFMFVVFDMYQLKCYEEMLMVFEWCFLVFEFECQIVEYDDVFDLIQ